MFMNRRNLGRVLATIALCLCGVHIHGADTKDDAAPATQQTAMEIPQRVFAPTSFWYQALPADAPLHPNSANFVAEFLRQKKAYYGTYPELFEGKPAYAILEAMPWDKLQFLPMDYGKPAGK